MQCHSNKLIYAKANLSLFDKKSLNYILFLKDLKASGFLLSLDDEQENI